MLYPLFPYYILLVTIDNINDMVKTHLLISMWRDSILNIREGLIPTVLGSAVTATGYALKQKRGSNKMIANTVFGFGLAHIVLGAIDLVEHRR